MTPGAARLSTVLALKNRLLDWIFQWRGPERGTVVLVQRRVFILPSRQGLLFAGVILLMLVGSVNYDLSLGFILSFLLSAAGIQSMLHTFRNLAGLHVSAGRVAPVFAGEEALFSIRLVNPSRAQRFGIGVTRDREQADYADVPAAGEAVATVAVPAVRRGWLRPGRVTLFTYFPIGLFRAWSYADLDMRCLVYPAPAVPGLALPPPEPGAGRGGTHGSGQDEFSGLRPYRPGDSPRHVAWKAAARSDALMTKQFAGRASAELWLSWDALPAGLGGEARLAHLARWVIDADKAGLTYGLRLPGTTVAMDSGGAHRDDCLRALALHEQPAGDA